MEQPLHALILTNMYPTPERPAFGRFVRDQVEALRRIPGLEVEVHVIPTGAYRSAIRSSRSAFRGRRFDVVHAHYGLSAWPALGIRGRLHAVTLHGTDLADRRARPVTLAALPWLGLVGVVSEELAASIPRVLPTPRVLPCGVDLTRFHPINRRVARAELGLEADRRYLLFPADPARPEKRFDLVESLIAGPLAGEDIRVLTLGNVAPEEVRLYVNAANAVLVPSAREGFGLATLEALACDVPVLATPHGIAPEALAGISGALCAPFSADGWSAALAPHLADPDPRIAGRGAAQRYSSDVMAARVAQTWRERLARRS